MNSSLVNVRALIIGGVITVGMTIMLDRAGVFIVDPNSVSTPVYLILNSLTLVICWLALSFLIYKFPLYKVLGVLGLLVIARIAEGYMDIVFNPITIPLLILFWLGIAYLILPQFFEKYKIPILSVYGLVLSYFFIFRMMPNYVEEHHQNFLNFVLIPIPVFAVLWVYEQWRWLITLKADKAKAELTLLKNQINPHFFFNTLNNLYGLAVEKSDQAPDMILKLSDMMRYTIYDGKEDYVSLANEVAYLEDYIELHKIRYHKKVDISFEKDLTYTHKIAPLLLVVPLENAFKHGVESLTSDAFIELTIMTSPKDISFRIRNNFETNPLGSKGIGLENLKQRLALIYPNQHQLEISITSNIYTLSLEIESHELSNHR